MTKITGCILTKNEAPILSEAINNLKILTDEIIVVDNGSNDGTKEIVEKNGVKYIFSPDTILDGSRNIYLEEVKTEWVFVLDTDERIDKSACEKIINFCDSADEEIKAARLPKYEYLGNGQMNESMCARLYRSHRYIRYDPSPIHSTINYSIRMMNGVIKDLDAPIHHLDSLVKSNSLNKRFFYIDLLKETIKKYPDKYFTDGLKLFLSAEYAAINKYCEALQILNYILDSNCNIATKYYALFYVCRIYMLQQKYANVTEILKAYSVRDPKWYAKFCSILAEIEFLKGNDVDAKSLYYEALTLSPNDIQLLLNIAFLEHKQDPKKAIELLTKAYTNNPFLLNPLFYRKVDSRYNVFYFQKALDLLHYNSTNIFNIMISCLGQLARYDEIMVWNALKKSSEI